MTGSETDDTRYLEDRLQVARGAKICHVKEICSVARDAAAAGHGDWARRILVELAAEAGTTAEDDPDDELRAHDCITIAQALAESGATDEARAIYEQEGETTISFVYCIDLAENALSWLDDKPLARALYKHALRNLEIHGLTPPITNDVEEEDHYYAEIAASVIRTLGDEQWGRRILLAAGDDVTWVGGRNLWHLLWVSRSISHAFTLELIEHIAQMFEAESADWDSWAYLARGALYYAESKRAAGKLVTRGRRSILEDFPEKRKELKEQEAKLREQLSSMDTLSKVLPRDGS